MKRTIKALGMVAIAIAVGAGTLYAADYYYTTGDDALRTQSGRDYIVMSTGLDTIAMGPDNDAIIFGPGDGIIRWGGSHTMWSDNQFTEANNAEIRFDDTNDTLKVEADEELSIKSNNGDVVIWIGN